MTTKKGNQKDTERATTELMMRDIQLLRQNLTVSRCLIQNQNKIAVLEDVGHLAGGQQIFDVLRDPGRHSALFSEPFPNFNAVGRRLLLLQQTVCRQ